MLQLTRPLVPLGAQISWPDLCLTRDRSVSPPPQGLISCDSHRHMWQISSRWHGGHVPLLSPKGSRAQSREMKKRICSLHQTPYNHVKRNCKQGPERKPFQAFFLSPGWRRSGGNLPRPWMSCRRWQLVAVAPEYGACWDAKLDKQSAEHSPARQLHNYSVSEGIHSKHERHTFAWAPRAHSRLMARPRGHVQPSAAEGKSPGSQTS